MKLYYLDPALCIYFVDMYYESGVMMYCAWSSVLVLGEVHDT